MSSYTPIGLVSVANNFVANFAGGSIEALSAADVVLAIFTGLAFGTPNATTGIVSATGMPKFSTPIATGICTKYRIKKSDGSIFLNGAAGRYPFTAGIATDIITATSHNFVNGDSVYVASTGLLPDPLAAPTIYYVINSATNTFQLSATLGGAAIDLTNIGTGVHYAYKTTTELLLVASIVTDNQIELSSFTFDPDGTD